MATTKKKKEPTKIFVTNPGPPVQRCEFNFVNGYLLVTVQDPTSNRRGVCAVTLTKKAAMGLSVTMNKFAQGTGKKKDQFTFEPAGGDRTCLFDPVSGKLSTFLGDPNDPSCSARILIPRDDAQRFADAAEIFATRRK